VRVALAQQLEGTGSLKPVPGGGGFAELALASADRLAPMPAASFQEAAGLVIGGGTACEGSPAAAGARPRWRWYKCPDRPLPTCSLATRSGRDLELS
jgi:NADPH:quinone reductase-like Zn-dependent oxidoreductase